MRIIDSEKDNCYNSKTKNNSNNGAIMRIMHIIGSKKNNRNNSSQINNAYNSLR
jgi:hypothetical protein